MNFTITKVNEKRIEEFFYTNFRTIILAAAVVVFMAVIIIFLKPLYDENTMTGDLIDKLISENGEITTLEKKLDVLNINNAHKKEATENDRALINKVYYKKGEEEKMMTEIEGIIKSNGFIVSSIGITDGGAVAGFENTLGSYKTSIAITGANYEIFKRFLGELENNLRMIDVISLNFTPDGGASFEIQTYYHL